MLNRSTNLSIRNITKSNLMKLGAIIFLFVGIASATLIYVLKTREADAVAMNWGNGCTSEVIGSSNRYVNVGVQDGYNNVCVIGGDDNGWTKSSINEFVFVGALIPHTYKAPTDSMFLFSADSLDADYYDNLEKFTLGGAVTFDTSNTTSMYGMFYKARSLTTTGINNLISNSGFRTSNVTDMTAMFGGTSSITELDLSSFNTSNVTSMNLMFAGMYNLETLTLGSNFTTNNVTNMEGMFATFYDIPNNSNVNDKFRTLILKTSFTFKGNTYLNGTWCRNGSTTDCYSDFSSGTTLPAGTYTKQTSTPDPDPDPDPDPGLDPDPDPDPDDDIVYISIPSSNPNPLTYTGSQQYAPGFDSEKMSYTAAYDTPWATNVGDYVSVVQPINQYRWTNNTQDPIQISWSIQPADPDPPSTLPTGLEGNVGDALSTVSLPNNYRWRYSSATINSGTNSYQAYYNPQPYTGNYNDLLVYISVKGNVTDPVMPTNLSANDLPYNGSTQTVTINNFDPDTMNVSGNQGKDVGLYTARVTSKTGQWSNGSSSAVEVSWRIIKGTPTQPTLPSNLEGREGYTLSTVSPGSNFSWSNSDQQISFGRNSYSAKYNPDPDNYNDLSVSIYVTGFRYQTKPSLASPTTFTYDTTTHTPTINNPFNCGVGASDKTSETNAGPYTITCVLPEYYKWGDGSTNDVVLNWEITPAVLTPPSTWSLNYRDEGYDILEDNLVPGYDPETMSISGETTATDAGPHEITIAIINKTNYKWSNGSTDDISRYWYINKVEADPTPFERDAETPINGNTGDMLEIKAGAESSAPDGCAWKTPSQVISHGENKYIALCGADNNHTATEVEFTVIGFTRIDIPTVKENLVYNGNNQTGLDGFDEATMDVVSGSDSPSQRDAKSYRTVLRPKAYYAWKHNDGEVYPAVIEQVFVWSIAKKASTAETFPTNKLSGDVGDKLETIEPYNGCSWENKNETVKVGENPYSAICYEGNDKNNFEPVTIKIPIIGTEQPIKPTIATNIYYNGKEQTGIIGFNLSTMEIVSGTIKATKAGTYSVEIKSKTGKWNDKTTENVRLNWEIKKRVAPSDRPSEYPSQKENDDDLKNVYKTATVGDKLKTIDPPTTDTFKCYWKTPEELIKKGKNAYIAVCAEDGDFDNNESFEVQVYVLGVEKKTDPGKGDDPSSAPGTGLFGSDSSFAKAVKSTLIVSPFVAVALVVVVKNRRTKIDFKKRN